MMQTADQRDLDHAPTVWRLHRPRDWTVVRERSVRADFMIIFEVGFENVRQLPFIEHDHSIQTFPPDGSDEPLEPVHQDCTTQPASQECGFHGYQRVG